MTHAYIRRDARNLRGTCKKGIKKEESSDSDIAEPKQFVAQPLYEEQKDQGMFYHQACVNPGDLQLEGGAEFDFNDYHPFPGLGNEEPAFPKDMSYNVNDFETFLDDATGGHGTIPTGTRYCEVELDADGVPIVDDFDPEGFVAQQDNFPTELPWANENHTKYNSFFFSDYSNVSSTNVSSEDIPLSKQPVAEILEHGVHVEEDLRQRVLGNLTMAGDQMTDQGLDVKQLISCIGEYTRLLVRGIETDVKPTIDSEGYALKPNPATLPMPY